MLEFTENERRVIWFLCIGFFSGLCVWIHKEFLRPLPENQVLSFEVDSIIPEEPGPNSELLKLEQKRAGKISNHRLNLNTASEQALVDLPGIGPVMAKRIIEHRMRTGPFQDPEDLLRV